MKNLVNYCENITLVKIERKSELSMGPPAAFYFTPPHSPAAVQPMVLIKTCPIKKTLATLGKKTLSYNFK